MARRPDGKGYVGLAARRCWLQYVLVPDATERLLASNMDRVQLSPTAAPATPGNLYTPMEDGSDTNGKRKR